MTESTSKADLHHYLQHAREALVWKLEGLSEYDARRPVTPTGTNLLGLVKHLSGVEMLYLGFVFDRHINEPPPWFNEHAEPHSDKWATADESRNHIVSEYRRAWTHADSTIDALDLATVGCIPWWPEGGGTLHRVLVHLIAETERHAGHADIVRELIDGAVGRYAGADQMNPGPGDTVPRDPGWWEAHRARIDGAARQAGGH